MADDVRELGGRRAERPLDLGLRGDDDGDGKVEGRALHASKSIFLSKSDFVGARHGAAL